MINKTFKFVGKDMDEYTVRVQSIELENFKNVEYGRIELPPYDREDSMNNHGILGIYGQNGSGKTAVVDAIGILKDLMSQNSLENNVQDYIMKKKEEARLTFGFYFKSEEQEFQWEYSFSIGTKNGEAIVSREDIWISVYTEENGWSKKKRYISCDIAEEEVAFLPKKRWMKLTANSANAKVDLFVAKRMAEKERRSFLFSNELLDYIQKNHNRDIENLCLLVAGRRLAIFAVSNLFVIKNNQSGVISLNILLPISYGYMDQEGITRVGMMGVSLDEPTVLELDKYRLLSKLLMDMNLVINSIIPGMKLEIKEYGSQVSEVGNDAMRFEVLSVRGDKKIPIRYESEGIKKILSILNLLVLMYNHESVCVVVDELDAGVYEYLLGELLGILEEKGRGQLIFTSHNLRPLEMIHKNSLVFTTTNPKNRYIRMMNVKANNNLRDLYLRSINLGGQKEQIYEKTNGFEISRALRKAGRDMDGEN